MPRFINIIMVLRVIGWLLLVEAVFMGIPLLTALFYGEECWEAFLVSMGLTAGAGFMMMSLRPRSRDMGKREAIMLTALVWITFSLFGMLPFLLGGTHATFTDAYFEAISGYTTTGISILPSIDALPKSIIMWRCVMQWIGGMGIILFTLAVIPMLNYQGGMQLFNAEVSGITRSKLRPRVSSTAKGLWGMYFMLSGAIIGLLAFSDMGVFNAICYGMTTMSTGGFSTTDAGIGEFDSGYIKIVISVFMFLGGVNFALLFQAVTGNYKAVWVNTAFRWLCGMVLAASVVMAISIITNGEFHSVEDVTVDPIFQSISILSSTGLTEPDFNRWGSLALSLIVFMMFVGACAGSTCGGAKIDRFVVVVKNIRNEFYRMMHPNAVLTIRMNGKGTPSGTVHKAVMFIVLYIVVILVGGTALICMGIPMEDSYFSVLEAISNTGLGVDLGGQPANYFFYPVACKWVLCFVMLTGRLELYTVLLLFTTMFWKK